MGYMGVISKTKDDLFTSVTIRKDIPGNVRSILVSEVCYCSSSIRFLSLKKDFPESLSVAT